MDPMSNEFAANLGCWWNYLQLCLWNWWWQADYFLMSSTAGGSSCGSCCMFFVFLFLFFFWTGWYNQKKPSHPSAPVATATATSSPSYPLVKGVFTPCPCWEYKFWFDCNEVFLFVFFFFYSTNLFYSHVVVLLWVLGTLWFPYRCSCTPAAATVRHCHV